jgi:hypothetical protein
VNYEEMDPGIRRVVRWMNEVVRIETCDSGDGVSKKDMECALDVPNVAAEYTSLGTAQYAADRLLVELRRLGKEPEQGDIQVTYDPLNRSVLVTLMGWDDARMFE